MSIHPSLSSSKQGNKQGSVLKRIERLRFMLEKGQWKEGDNVYNLPKIKILRIKIKKEKAEKAETTALEGAAPAAAAAAPAAKAPAAKGSPAKDKK